MSSLPNGHLVPQRRVELDQWVARVEERYVCLLGRALRRVLRTQCLDLVEVPRVPHRSKRRGWSDFAELRATTDEQRGHESHPRHSERRKCGRRRPPNTRRFWLRELNRWVVASVIYPLRDQSVGGQLAECDAASFGIAVGDFRQRCCVEGIEVGMLRSRRVGHQNPVSGSHRRRLRGSPVRCMSAKVIRLVTTFDANHGVVDRRVHEPHIEEVL